MVDGKLIQCCYREQLGYSLYRTFREPKLYRMAATGAWEGIPDRCRQHPAEATFRHRYPPQDTALHRILRVEVACGGCFGDVKARAVAALLDVYPAATVTSDSFGRTPLHLACMDRNCTKIADIFYMFPKAAQEMDVERRMPLHYLVARGGPVLDEPLVRLMATAIATRQQKDAVGDTAYDILLRRREEVENADEILPLLLATADAPTDGIKGE